MNEQALPADRLRAIDEQLSGHELRLGDLLGTVFALKMGLNAVIATHPDPAALLRMFSAAVVETIDAKMARGTYDALPGFADGFHRESGQLQTYLEQLLRP